VSTKPASRWKRVVFGVGLPLAVSAALIAWVFSQIEDTTQVWNSILGAALLPLILAVPVNLASHFLRALRWRRFIGKPVSSYFAFSSVMIGYAVNGVIPRGGELARVVNMHRMTGLPIAHLLTTLVIERLLDFLSLLTLFGISMLLYGDYVSEKFPVLMGAAFLPLIAVGVGFALLVLLAFFSGSVSAWLRKRVGRNHPALGDRLAEIVAQGAEGLTFFRRPSQIVMVLLETVGIWTLLWVTFLLALISFDLYSAVGTAGSVVTYSITNASVFVPSAGAIGAFHVFGQDSLVLLYQIDPARALAFATALHLIVYYLVPVGGGVTTWLGQ
jgi:uncharacterized protein (TIRG00374 family)